MLRPSPNHGTQRLPNDDDDVFVCACVRAYVRIHVCACVFVLLALYTQLPSGQKRYVGNALTTT